MDSFELAHLIHNCGASAYDLDVLQSCTLEKWDVLYSPGQVNAAVRRIRECASKANKLLDLIGQDQRPISAQQALRVAERIGPHEYVPTEPYHGCGACGIGPGAYVHNTSARK